MTVVTGTIILPIWQQYTSINFGQEYASMGVVVFKLK